MLQLKSLKFFDVAFGELFAKKLAIALTAEPHKAARQKKSQPTGWDFLSS
jgi:hypothetical protein